MNVGLSELRELVMNTEAWRAAIHGVAKSRTRLSNWADLIWSDLIVGTEVEYNRNTLYTNNLISHEANDSLPFTVKKLKSEI